MESLDQFEREGAISEVIKVLTEGYYVAYSTKWTLLRAINENPQLAANLRQIVAKVLEESDFQVGTAVDRIGPKIDDAFADNNGSLTAELLVEILLGATGANPVVDLAEIGARLTRIEANQQSILELLDGLKDTVNAFVQDERNSEFALVLKRR